MRYGERAGENPWGAYGLEWQIPSPPPTHNFEEKPVVTTEAYDYYSLKEKSGWLSNMPRVESATCLTPPTRLGSRAGGPPPRPGRHGGRPLRRTSSRSRPLTPTSGLLVGFIRED